MYNDDNSYIICLRCVSRQYSYLSIVITLTLSLYVALCFQ